MNQIDIHQMINSRWDGELIVRFAPATWLHDDLNILLIRLGFPPVKSGLRKIPESLGHQFIEFFIGTNLAYGGQAMRSEEAAKYAQRFIETCVPKDSEFYTNGFWEKFPNFSWSSFTEATFDGGVIAMNEESAVALWVKDED